MRDAQIPIFQSYRSKASGKGRKQHEGLNWLEALIIKFFSFTHSATRKFTHSTTSLFYY